MDDVFRVLCFMCISEGNAGHSEYMITFSYSMLQRKDLGHFWLGYIRMLGHFQMSAHLVNFECSLSEFWQAVKRSNFL